AREAVTLYYSPGFQTDPDLTSYLQRCERGLADFAKQFGFPLKRRLVVYLFATQAEYGRLFASGMTAGALPGGDAILMVAGEVAPAPRRRDSPPRSGSLVFALRGSHRPAVQGRGVGDLAPGNPGREADRLPGPDRVVRRCVRAIAVAVAGGSFLPVAARELCPGG